MADPEGQTFKAPRELYVLMSELGRVWHRGLAGVDGRSRPNRLPALDRLEALEALIARSPWRDALSRQDAIRELIQVACCYCDDGALTESDRGEGRALAGRISVLFGIGPEWKNYDRTSLWLAATEGIRHLRRHDFEAPKRAWRKREEDWRRKIWSLLANALYTAAENEFRLPMTSELPTQPNDLGPHGVLFGREPLLAELLDTASAKVILITGMPGVGKTSFALELGFRLRDRYPDGQVFVDVQGFGIRDPLSRDEVIKSVLTGLGYSEVELPSNPDHLLSVYRSALFEKRLLLVLDNVAEASVVSDLVPPGEGATALVTSRRGLASLRMTTSVQEVELPLLSPEVSFDLLASHIGPVRTSSDPEAIKELVEICGQLPFALTLIGAKLASRKRQRLHTAVSQLTAIRGRILDETTVDSPLNVRTVLQWSIELLTPAQRKLLRALVILPVGIITDELLAELPIDLTVAKVEQLLDEHLIQERETGGYFVHDLIALFIVYGANGERQVVSPEDWQLITAAIESVLHHLLAQYHPDALVGNRSRAERTKEQVLDDGLNILNLASWCAGSGLDALRPAVIQMTLWARFAFLDFGGWFPMLQMLEMAFEARVPPSGQPGDDKQWVDLVGIVTNLHLGVGVFWARSGWSDYAKGILQRVHKLPTLLDAEGGLESARPFQDFVYEGFGERDMNEMLDRITGVSLLEHEERTAELTDTLAIFLRAEVALNLFLGPENDRELERGNIEAINEFLNVYNEARQSRFFFEWNFGPPLLRIGLWFVHVGLARDALLVLGWARDCFGYRDEWWLQHEVDLYIDQLNKGWSTWLESHPLA
jgi:hypothetical protein